MAEQQQEERGEQQTYTIRRKDRFYEVRDPAGKLVGRLA